MKILKAISLSSILLLASCSGKDKDSFHISGYIDGLPDSTVVILTPLAHRSLDPVAEDTVVNGRFEFTGVTTEPIAVTLSVKNQYGSKIFMLDNGDVTISGSVTVDNLGDGKNNYDFSGIKFDGSPLTDEYYAMMAPRHYIDSLFIDNQRRHSGLQEQLAKAFSEKNRQTLDSLKATEEYKVYGEKEKYYFQAFDSVLNATISSNRNTIWGPIALLSQLSYLSPEYREVYESFTDSIKDTFHGRMIAEELYPVGRPGDKMPDFDATTIDGKHTSLTALSADKKYIILDFWASWCGPCRREIPNLKKIHEKYADKGFDIISISIDSDDAPWRKAVTDEGLSWVNIRDNQRSIADLYKVTAVPTIYIVDNNGCLVDENLHGEELAARIDELMAR